MPNVLRGGDDFIAGANDMFMFAFGGPKVREADATVGGVRAVEIDDKPDAGGAQDLPATAISATSRPARSSSASTKPMKVYTIDNILFTNAKMKDDLVVQDHRHDGEQQGRHGRGRAGAARLLGRHDVSQALPCPYHPGALKYFKDKKHRGQGVLTQSAPSDRRAMARGRGAAHLRRVGGALHRQHGGVRLRRRRRRPSSLTNVLQALLVACVVLWVLDVPRQVFNVSFYTEQLLAVCLGLTLALAFIAETQRASRAPIDLGGAIAVDRHRSIYIAYRYRQRAARFAVAGGRGARRWRWPGPSLASRAAYARWFDWLCAIVSLLLVRLHRGALRGADLRARDAAASKASSAARS